MERENSHKSKVTVEVPQNCLQYNKRAKDNYAE